MEGGYTPAARWIVRTDRGSRFVKVGTTDTTRGMLRREFRSYGAIKGSFLPECDGWEDDEMEPILVIEDLSGYFWPPPWEEGRVELVLARIREMHRASADLPGIEEAHGARQSSWGAVAADPQPFLSLGMAGADWLDRALPLLIRAEEDCEVEGTALTHCDIRSDNICIAADGAKLIDWPDACLANPELDLGFWLPSLAFEQGPAPEAILPDAPEVAAWVAGFFAARAGRPQISDAPRVRLVQRQQLTTALPWAARALGLSAPDGQLSA